MFNFVRNFIAMENNILSELKSAFKLTIPVLGAYWFLGMTYGLLAASLGYSIWVPLSMAMVVYSGSVEFVALTMLSGVFQPVASVIMAFTIGARHLFYGIAMLERWRGAGRLKPFLIYLMSDETFAVNYSQGGSFKRQLIVSVLDYVYWSTGALLGFCLGANLPQSFMLHLKGLDFVVTAMFVAIFMDDYMRHPATRHSGWLGVGATSVCLLLFGAQQFILPTMMLILTVLYIVYRRKEAGK